jgi:iron complex transport system permease protein
MRGGAVLFREEEQKRFSLRRDTRNTLIAGLAMLVVFVLSVLLVFNLLHPNLSAAWISQGVARRVRDMVDLFSGNRLESGIHFFLCQFICPMLAGIALAASGACFQGIFRNPMASPTMLGVESGGSLGALAYALFFYAPPLSGLLTATYEGYAMEYGAMTIGQKYGQYFFVLAGCVVIVIVVMSITKAAGRGRISTVPMMVGGTVFTGTITSLITMVQYYLTIRGGNPMIISVAQSLQLGSFQNISTPWLLLCFSVPVFLPFIALVILSPRLNVISLGEEEARLLGVDTGRDRMLLVMLSTLMTAAVVAFCGAISFIGLIAPHFARMAVGNDFRRLVPASAFVGGIFMLLACDLSYMINGILNAGNIVNVTGAAFFLIFMTRYRRKGHADWA